jgi:peptide/nickel transport system permease protein
MFLYILRRLIFAIPTLLLVAVAVFTLLRSIPGDPALLMLGDSASDTELTELRRHLGLDLILPLQFGKWLIQVLSGDLGYSITNGEPVLALIVERFQVTFVIVVTAVSLAICISIPAGLIATWKQNKGLDIAIVVIATLLLSVPAFWLGLILLLIFGMQLAWLPVVGYVALSDDFYQGLRYVLLPIITLAMVETGVLIRMVRSSSIEVLRLEYVAHARAKGAGELRVLLLHVLPNSFAPVLTMIGLILGHLLGGAAVLETVFTLPGLGRLLVDAIFSRDYPVIQGVLIFTASIYVCINLVVDFCYPIFDPKVRLE